MRLVAACLFALLLASPPALAEPSIPPYGLPALDRADFNRLAVTAGLPLFWRSDLATPRVLEASELAVLRGGDPARWVGKGGDSFTPAFRKAYQELVELRRREAVRAELAQGRPTLVETDLTGASAEDKAIVARLLVAARQIDALYQIQDGAAAVASKVPRDDLSSRALLERNQGPWCQAPLTEADPFCNAAPGFPPQVTASWPSDVRVDHVFCEAMAKEPNATELTAPFTVVRHRRGGAGFVAVPYTTAYAAPMKAVAATLAATAKLVKSPEEAAFKAYLEAAAKAFRDNDWVAADEAWSAMGQTRSRWYLRVGPDETYWDPCQLKAGFHMSFALIDRTALEWKERLTAVRTELEETLAALIGPPYAARAVSFELPEFINIIVNAGDSRDGLGATIGQSLPNFGRVAEESRGRTVAMVNLYTDADSLADMQKRDRSLFSDATFAYASEDPAVERLGTVLHEATHNLGPYGSYKVDGKLPETVFGGATDAILEELKAQTGALYYLPFLAAKGFMSQDDVRRGYVANISWAFGHIARGMFDSEGHPKTYSQLAAIQVGELMKAGAIRWVEGGADVDPGRFDFDWAKFPAAVEALMKKVATLKAKGDVAGAKELIAEHTSAEGQRRIHAAVITERVLRFPKASFVYGVKGL